MIKTNKRICCEDFSLIENYELALNDETQVWECHHRLGVTENGFLSKQQLKDMGLYFNRPACELIFLTKSEHDKLHAQNPETRQKIKDKFDSEKQSKALKEYYKTHDVWNKGKSMKENEEYYRNFLAAMEKTRGKDTWMKGRHHTDYSKQLISEHNWTKNPEYADKLKEMGEKVSAALTGLKTINNGTISKRVKPELLDEYLSNGWVLGFITTTNSEKMKGRKAINNGTISKLVGKEELDEYLSTGWKLGRLNKKKE